jgi:hypothetical protein
MSPMKRRRPLTSCDIGSDGITRTDTVPAAVRFAEEESVSSGDASVPSSGFQWSKPRELPAYPPLPELPPSFNESTVPDGPLQRAAMVPHRSSPRVVDDSTPVPAAGVKPYVDVSMPPAATRIATPRPFVGTPAAPAAARIPTPRPYVGGLPLPMVEATPRPRETLRSPAREQQPSVTPHGSEPPARAEARAPVAPPARGASAARLFAIGVLTVVASAAVGASLGDGSLARVVERLRGTSVKQTPTPAPPNPSRAPAPRPVAKVEGPAPAPVVTVEAPRVPVMRLDDLPVVAEASAAEEPVQSAPVPRSRPRLRPRPARR